MEEEKEEKQEVEEESQQVVKEEKQESEDLISKANAAAARLEAANKVTADLVARQEKLQVEKTMGGKADAQPVQTKESPEEYSKRVMRNEIE